MSRLLSRSQRKRCFVFKHWHSFQVLYEFSPRDTTLFLLIRNHALDLSFPLQLSHSSANKWQAFTHAPMPVLAYFPLTSINKRCCTDAKPGRQTNPTPSQCVCQVKHLKIWCAIFKSKLNKVPLKLSLLGLYWVPRFLVLWARETKQVSFNCLTRPLKPPSPCLIGQYL